MKYYNIPVFVPHMGCPFDCVFCNQHRITGTNNEICYENVKSIIEEHLKLLPRKNSRIEIAFFGGSFTGIDEKLQEELLSCAYLYVEKKEVSGIRVSTRPDYINHEVMRRLIKYNATSLELGVQSMDDCVLLASCRGHSAEDVKKAVEIIRKYPVKLGLQMMTGLPGDTFNKSLETAQKLIALKPDFVRIYPTLVIRDTALEKMYKEGKYKPQTTEEAAELCSKLLKKFTEAGIEVIRIGLQNTDEISSDGSVVAGPFHSAFGEIVRSKLYYDKIAENIENIYEKEIFVSVNPAEVSKAVGQKRENIKRIKENFGKNLKIKGNPEIKKGEIKIKGR